jgi:two-component system nitrogen regulation response regulator GlnG
MSTTLLVIDDDEASCRLVRATFTAEGIRVLAAHDGPAGLAYVEAEHPDIVLLDVKLPTSNGVEILERLKAAHPLLPVVMLTASRDVQTAVRATQLGAFHYLTKPIDHDDLVTAVRRAVEARALRLEVEDLRRRVNRNAIDQLAVEMGPSGAIKELLEQVAIVAASTFTVLIVGETGSGKELVARAIHRQSERRGHAFIALDCGAIHETLLESELFGHEKGAFTGADRRRMGHVRLAAGGTCFLDEIGNLPASQQAKLLRVLESREVRPLGGDAATPVDVRFIAATHDDLPERARAGGFRADLYFRFAQYTITVPPLRARREDLAYLAQRFLDEVSVELRRPMQQLASAALAELQRAAWPGNVRELRNVIRQAVLRSNGMAIRPSDLRALLSTPTTPAGSSPSAGGTASLKEVATAASRNAERDAICSILRVTNGNKSRAARALQTDYKTLHLKMKQLGIRARDFVA